MSSQTLFPISEIGFTAASVILLAPRAAMTAIQRMTRARVLTMIVPMIPVPVSNAFLAHFDVSVSRRPTVLSVTPLGPLN